MLATHSILFPIMKLCMLVAGATLSPIEKIFQSNNFEEKVRAGTDHDRRACRREAGLATVFII